MGFEIPKYGIEIDFIDNTGPRDADGKLIKQGPIVDLGGGFMTDSIDSMIEHCEDTAKKLRDYKRERGL